MDQDKQKLLRRKSKYAESGNYQQFADVCSKLGELYSENGEYLKAMNEYKLVAKAYQMLKMPMDVGRANRLVGEMFMLLEQFQKALQYEKLYLDIARQEKNNVEQQRAYATIGRIYLLKGQSCDEKDTNSESLAEAEKSFLKSLKLSKDLKDVSKLERLDMEARLLLNLGVTKEHQGLLEDAGEYFHKACKIAENNDLLELLHQCYTAAAQFYNARYSNHTKALKLLNDALEVASRLQNKTTKMCETLLIKAHVLIRTGDFQSAKHALKKAYNLKTPLNSDAENIERLLKVLVVLCRVEDELITCDIDDYKKKKRLNEQMGDCACQLENYEKAIDYYLKMLECAQMSGEKERELIPCYVSLYQTYKDNKQYDDSLIYLWKEYDLISTIPEEAYNTLLSIAEILEAQEKTIFEIENIYRRARQEAKNMNCIKKERIAIKRCITTLKKQGMDIMVDNLERDAKNGGIDLDKSDDDSDDDDQADETENTFDEIDLSVLTDSEDDAKKNHQSFEARNARKRGTSFQIKKNNKGETQLHQACINGNKLLVEKLLQQGHPVNIRDNAGWLPLHEACIHGHKEIAEMLLDRGAHINDKGGTSCDGITPLYDACSNGNLEIVEMLLDRGANCTLRTDSGDTTINVLQAWFESVKKKISSDALLFYNTIRDRISTCFDKVGIKPNESATIPDAIEQDKPTSRSTRRRTTQVSDTDSEKDETRTIRTVSSNQSSGYGSAKKMSKSSINRRSRNTCSDSSELSSDSENDFDMSRSAVSKKCLSRSSGVDDYRNTIQIIRKGSTVRAQIVSPLKDPNPGPSKRSAHMRQEEVGDDWLVDDLGPDKKRQKFNMEKGFPDSSNGNDRVVAGRRTPPVSDPTISSTETNPGSSKSIKSLCSDSSDDGTDAYQVLMNASKKSFRSNPKSKHTFQRQRSSTSTGYQASLLDAGFNNSRSNSPTVEQIEQSFLSPTKHTAGQETLIKCTPDEGIGEQLPAKTMPSNVVRVIVDGHPIDISYDEVRLFELNVGWLINEVEKRFGIEHGKRPMLKLLRRDGELCQDSDPMTTLLGTNETIVNSYVIEYKPLSSAQFYEDYCNFNDIEKLSDLLKALGKIEDTGVLALKQDFFEETEPQWDILFRAIELQKRVLKVDLSLNTLTDSVLDQFLKQTTCLKYLETLNISRNFISNKTLSALVTIVTADPTTLQHLTELDLSHNTLMDECLPDIAKLLQHLKQLKILRLASTGITNLTVVEPPLDISKLQVFDVSQNVLNQKSIDYIFTNVNSRILSEMNLEFLGKLKEFKPSFILFVENNEFDMLRTLNLRSCDLTDTDFAAMIGALAKGAHSLKDLDVSYNSKLTQASLVEVFRTFTSHSLDTLRFWQNPSILNDVNDNLFDAIQYAPNKQYPLGMELMMPLRLEADMAQQLTSSLRQFWERIWKERNAVGALQVIKNKMKFTISSSVP